MFDYPIPPLRGGLYAELGLGPEATAEEINESRQELSTRVKQQQKKVQRELDSVYQHLPELREIWAKLKSTEHANADANSDDYWKLHSRLAALEEEAVKLHSGFKSLRDEAAALEKRIHEVNLMAIQSPDDRLQYDRSHPPFEIIKLADCAATSLDDRKSMLTTVRSELSDFLEQAGEDVFHPSDLTRIDFSHDFTKDKNLDGA